jgi:DNA end-binding protein Ku
MFSKATWTGTISFGLVSVPVKLYGATEEHGIEMHEAHPADGGRVGYKRECKGCGKELAYGDIGRSVVDVDGHMHVFTKDEFDALTDAKDHAITLDSFCEPHQIDPLHLGKTYYVRPDFLIKKRGDAPRANKPYALFAESLLTSGKAAIGRMVMRSRESLVAITVHEDVMVLRVILWADEIREPAFQEPDAPAVTVTAEETTMALQLVDAMTTKFDINSHVDRRELALSDLIASRRQPVVAQESNVVSLLSRLPQPAQTHAV